MKSVFVDHIEFSNQLPFVLIAGPCQIESLTHAEFVAGTLAKICQNLNINLVYKSSFDKANRTSVKTQRGIGIDEGLAILNTIKHKFNIPVLTDIHLPEQAQICADAGIDILQIPAFLSRQTDLLVAAGETGLAVNIKKGQFMAPWDMANAADKIASTGNSRIMLCERGVTHGYNTLVVDMQSLPIMARTGYPVVFDATHSVQKPGGHGTSSGGNRDMIPYLAQAAVATGCVSSVFMEVHENPDSAPSDGPNMIPLTDLEKILNKLKLIDAIVK